MNVIRNRLSPRIWPWIWQMAWRDSRSSRKRLFLLMSSIILGVAALVAISSFRTNLETVIDKQAKLLVGADLIIGSRQPFKPQTEALIDSIGGRQSRQVSFPSMICFMTTGETRLAQIRALQGDFPYYGQLETEPPAAAKDFRSAAYALVDEAMMIQFKAQPGDSVKIGVQTFQIRGGLKRIPAEAAASAFLGPRVYIPMAYLDRTNLLQKGSIARYRVFFKFKRGYEIDKLVAKIQDHAAEYRLQIITVESRQRFLGQTMNNLYRFLNLTGFIALLLGAVGVASAIHVYIKQKLSTIAILRCLGAKNRQIMMIYLIQASAMGLIGAFIGSILGIIVQLALPQLLRDFLPLQIDFRFSGLAVVEGLSIGLGIALLFALVPLTTVRSVSPLLTLRSSYNEKPFGFRDPYYWLANGLIVAGVIAVAMFLTDKKEYGLGFSAAIGIVFGLLTIIAKLITTFAKHFVPPSWPYIWRQGLANLHRPNNQTIVLMLSIGLGTFLVMTLYQTRNILLDQIRFTNSKNRPNLIFFDVQVDQKNKLKDLIGSFNLPILHEDPIVTNRLTEINGRPVVDLLKDPAASIPEWALMREYRSTYRQTMTSTEKLIAGVWIEQVENLFEPTPISIEKEIAEDLEVTLGDELRFDVQGVSVATKISSIREVDWSRFQTNFFVVFPVGVLEDAPQFFVLTTRTPSNSISAELQQQAVNKFPNVSAIDLTLILKTIDGLLNRIAFVIRFMALFSIITGLTVLVGAVITSRFQRIQESILLRTLGASQRQVIQIMLIEYLFLGLFAAATGLILSMAGSWALAHFVFDTSFVPTVLPIIIALLIVILLTILTGMFNSRGIHRKPPLEVLRQEV